MSEAETRDVVNRAQSSGQMHDLKHTTSDDGTVPPTAIREAITTPEKKSGNGRASRAAGNSGDPALRSEREQPGENGAPSLPHAMDEEPNGQADRQNR
jgi:hypothetical protein